MENYLIPVFLHDGFLLLVKTSIIFKTPTEVCLLLEAVIILMNIVCVDSYQIVQRIE